MTVMLYLFLLSGFQCAVLLAVLFSVCLGHCTVLYVCTDMGLCTLPNY